MELAGQDCSRNQLQGKRTFSLDIINHLEEASATFSSYSNQILAKITGDTDSSSDNAKLFLRSAFFQYFQLVHVNMFHGTYFNYIGRIYFLSFLYRYAVCIYYIIWIYKFMYISVLKTLVLFFKSTKFQNLILSIWEHRADSSSAFSQYQLVNI